MSDMKIENTKQVNLNDLTFEEALLELEKIVSSLESGDVSLDDAIEAYTRGMLLKSHCQARLEEAKLRVEKIRVPNDSGDKITSESFDNS